MQLIDTNHDGKLDRNEFATFVELASKGKARPTLQLVRAAAKVNAENLMDIARPVRLQLPWPFTLLS